MKQAKITRRCPFCYAPASEIKLIEFRVRYGFKKMACVCDVCGARGPSSLSKRSTRAEVIFDWNLKATIKEWTRTDYQKARILYARTHE